jgi:ABC-type dipeptide/oligopeptide/nickel transport system permease component
MLKFIVRRILWTIPVILLVILMTFAMMKLIKGNPNVFTFDLGPSLIQRNRDVNDVIKAAFPVSLKLGGLAMLFAIVVGIPLGIIAALKQNTPIDYAAMAVVNAGYALPNFLIATLLI